jgi:hypothetical protein
MSCDEIEFEKLRGETLKSIEGCEIGSESVIFTCENGKRYRLYHYHDCCETVSLNDIAGDISDLIGVPLEIAELVVSNDDPVGALVDSDYRDSFTWSFYKLATKKGYVTLRWYGESNGYYSETVRFGEVTEA